MELCIMKPELKGKNSTLLDKVTTLIFIQRFFKKHQVKEISRRVESQMKLELKVENSSESHTGDICLVC